MIIKSRLIKWFFKKCTKMYRTYNKAKDAFIEPQLVAHARWWRKSSCLPMWRRGPQIILGKYQFDYTTDYHYAKLIDSHWTPTGKKRHPILSRLCKPVIQLPIWLTFRIFNWDTMWKTKYDSYRFEFPPQFSLILFGYAFDFWLSPPEGEDADHYWEAILAYSDPCKFISSPDLEYQIVLAGKYIGVWTKWPKGSDDGVKYWALSSTMLKSPAKEIWEEYQEQHKEELK